MFNLTHQLREKGGSPHWGWRRRRRLLFASYLPSQLQSAQDGKRLNTQELGSIPFAETVVDASCLGRWRRCGMPHVCCCSCNINKSTKHAFHTSGSPMYKFYLANPLTGRNPHLCMSIARKPLSGTPLVKVICVAPMAIVLALVVTI